MLIALSTDSLYIYSFVIVGLSVLQNGKLPQFLPEDTINSIFNADSTSQSLINLKKGLEKLGLFQVINYTFIITGKYSCCHSCVS